MQRSDTWATIIYVLALVLLLGVGGMEYMRYNQRSAVDKVVQQEKDLRSKADALKTRAQAAEAQKPLIATLEAPLMKPENGNYYRQLLLDAVANTKTAGVQFPSYAFAQTGALGKFPQYSITGQATGTDAQVFEFVRLFEEGPFKVQVTSINYTSAAGAAAIAPPPEPSAGQPAKPAITGAGQAQVSVTLVYAAQQ